MDLISPLVGRHSSLNFMSACQSRITIVIASRPWLIEAVKALRTPAIAILGLASAMCLPAKATDGQTSQEMDTGVIVGLIDTWGLAAARCRKGVPGARETRRACQDVHLVVIKLDDLGWCYGHESDPGPFFRRWHRCGIESLHPPRP